MARNLSAVALTITARTQERSRRLAHSPCVAVAEVKPVRAAAGGELVYVDELELVEPPSDLASTGRHHMCSATKEP